MFSNERESGTRLSPSSMAIIAIVSSALLLRCWSAAWGWPYGLYGDEVNYSPNALRMAADRTLNPGRFHNSHLFTYFCLAEVAVAFVAGRFVGVYQDAAGFGAYVWTHATGFLVAARLTSAVLGAATVALLYRVGSRLFDRTIGLIAALVLAVSPLHVYYSKVAVNDVCMVLFVLLATNAAIGVRENGSWRSIGLAGLWTGLAAGSKYNGGFVVMVPAIAIALRAFNFDLTQRPVTSRKSVGAVVAGLAVLAGVSLLAFVASNPFSVLDLSTFKASFLQMKASGDVRWAGQSMDPVPLLMVRSLGFGLGLLTCIASIAGAVYMLKTRWETAVLVLAFPLAYAAYMGSKALFGPRFLLPIYPVLALAAACGIRWAAIAMAGRAERVRLPLRAITLVSTALIVAMPLERTIAASVVLARRDTRLQARDWMATHVSAGARVLADFDASAALDDDVRPGVRIDLTARNREDLVEWDCGRIRAGLFDYVLMSAGLRHGTPNPADGDRFATCLEASGLLVSTLSPLKDSARTDDLRFADMTDLVGTVADRRFEGPPIWIYELRPTMTGAR